MTNYSTKYESDQTNDRRVDAFTNYNKVKRHGQTNEKKKLKPNGHTEKLYAQILSYAVNKHVFERHQHLVEKNYVSCAQMTKHGIGHYILVQS